LNQSVTVFGAGIICGINHTPLSAAEVYRLEPDLKRVFTRGLLIDASMSLGIGVGTD